MDSSLYPAQHNVVTEEVQPICVNVILWKRGGELCNSVSNFLKILNLLDKI